MPGSIPNLKFEKTTSISDSFEYEIHTNGCFRIDVELVGSEDIENVCFSDSRVSHEDDFHHVIDLVFVLFQFCRVVEIIRTVFHFLILFIMDS